MTDEVRQTRSDALKDAIAEAILTGELAPGQRLDEVSVAQRFAVSRTPVREALKQLAAMELIELRPHRGAVVAGLDPERLAELFEAMTEIEAACARIAAVKLTGPGRARLEIGVEAVRRRPARGRYRGDSYRQPGVSLGDPRRCAQQFPRGRRLYLRRRLGPLSRAQFGLTGRPDHSAAEHLTIMTAMRARDAAAAEQAMRRHLESVSRAFSDWRELSPPSAQSTIRIRIDPVDTA